MIHWRVIMIRYWAMLALPLLCSCAALAPRADKDDFEPDVYRLVTGGRTTGEYYAMPKEDSVLLYKVMPRAGQGTHPAELVSTLYLPAISQVPVATQAFFRPSLDLDLFTAPIKYRPATTAYPHQLQPVVNLNVYLGYRIDRFAYRYMATRAGFARRKYRHYGLSAGGFVGSGSEHIFPQVINRPILGEYDGWILSKGLAVFFGFQHLTVGLLAGTDQLLDRNRLAWLYHERPWIGLGLGINLN